MTIQELKELCIHAVSGTAPTNFTLDNVNAAVVDGLKQYCGSINQFMKNRYDIYEIVNEAADKVVPKKVIDAISMFAETKTIAQGEKALFHIKLGRNRAKKFVTRVGLSGVYETFRLDETTYEVSMNAIGAAVTVDFERVLDGAESLAEVMDIIAEGMTEAIYGEIQKALVSAASVMEAQGTNVVRANGFVADAMVKLVNTARSYGAGAVIFATPEFVTDMGPDAIVPATVNYAGQYSPDDIAAIHNNGRIRIFRGTPIVEIPQSFVDENNNETVYDPSYAYIFPTGGEKVVKVVFEGNQQIYDATNRDQSIEVHTYRKVGVGIQTYHDWCVYQNVSLSADTKTYNDDASKYGYFGIKA